MAKFNVKPVSLATKSKTTNNAGGVAYKYADVRQELASTVLTAMLDGGKYYETEQERVERLFDLINQVAKIDPEFLVKAMVYTRTVAGLRSVTHLMAVGIVECLSGSELVRKGLRKSFVRPDDLCETLALWNSRNAKVPSRLLRAFKDALESFSAFQLKRYSCEARTVKLRDVVKVSRPVDRKGLFKQLIEQTLPKVKTVESELAAGKSAESVVTELMNNKQLGYMAAIKQIESAIATGISETDLDALINLITDKSKILKSRVLPFRYYDAWREVKKLKLDAFKLRTVKRALETAFTISGANTDIISEGDRIAVILDESGSMQGEPFERGKVLSASLLTNLNHDDVVFYTFSYHCTERDIPASPFDLIDRFKAVGGGTNVHAPLEQLIATNTVVDKIIIFTDGQMYDICGYDRDLGNFLSQYRKIAPNVKVLFWNLQGYGKGTPVLLSNGVMEVAGYSDKMLAVIGKIWGDPKALIAEIMKIKL